MVRGFQQQEGIDFNETYISLVILPTWRFLLALATYNNWEIEQIDFIGAFLNADLEEDIFIEISEGLKEYFQHFPIPTHSYSPHQEQVIWLKHSLYDLKQSPQQ